MRFDQSLKNNQCKLAAMIITDDSSSESLGMIYDVFFFRSGFQPNVELSQVADLKTRRVVEASSFFKTIYRLVFGRAAANQMTSEIHRLVCYFTPRAATVCIYFRTMETQPDQELFHFRPQGWWLSAECN